MAANPNNSAMLTQRYGPFIDPLAEENSLAQLATWVPPESRLGNTFNFPLQASLEHGQTADVTGSVYNLNPDVPLTLVNAQVDGFDWTMTARIPYSDMLRARNGVNINGQAASYFKPLDMKVKGALRSAGLYRELWLAYGPGTGSTIASDIGQLGSASFLISGGPNWNQTPQVRLTTASWIPGLWHLMKNAKLEVLNAAGTALVGSAGQFVQVATHNPNLAQITMAATSTITAAVAASQRLLPFGWYQKCCIGLQGILNNTGTLFGVDAAANPFWQARSFPVGGTLTRELVLAMAAFLYPNGLENGGVLLVSPGQFQMLASEVHAQQRYLGEQVAKKVGTNKLEYISPVGVIEVRLYKFMKQGIAMFFGNGLVKRGGASDVTFRGDGNQYFLQEVSGAAGYEIRAVSNQAVYIEKPNQCSILTGIANTTYDVPGTLT